ncbi:uncharacterized protein LOC126656475 [Mercurialis annua]|uniref:uncharacterized protein LOC126656475 n=1 Tax=Mercurialis annua TaxID=3986 RepID=UPI0021606F1D|nr:uncharacterized protein LOC126656475 [Mercurialis annua]XP_050207007.1 uncharacterized protein LOC126656475 [Mercurialis annua]XP_050207008.1 uncharacterized protein LOC126656475 [Mercurialis annua]
MIQISRIAVIIIIVFIFTKFDGTTSLSLCKISGHGLLACKPSATRTNTVDPPPQECCQALTGANLTCLCSFRDSQMMDYIGFDSNLALGLPAKCNLKLPSDCRLTPRVDFTSSRSLDLCNMSDKGLFACKLSELKPVPLHPPLSECCQAIGESNVTCLSTYGKSPELLIDLLGIDPELAMNLPSKCNISTNS